MQRDYKRNVSEESADIGIDKSEDVFGCCLAVACCGSYRLDGCLERKQLLLESSQPQTSQLLIQRADTFV